MNILITGASGLLGSKLTEILIKNGYKVYAGYNVHKPLFGIPIKFDVSNGKEVEKAFRNAGPRIVIHAAALTNVDMCEVNRDLAWRINVEGTENIVKLSREYNVFLIYVSTDYVFRGDRGLYSEEDEPDPINYYGFTKLRGEEKVRKGIDEYCIVRTSVIYGSVPATGKINFVLWILEKLRKRETVKIVTDQWNSPTLNTNLAEMMLEILKRKLIGVYHLAGATRINRYNFAKLIAKTFNLDESLILPTTSDKIQWVAKRPKDSSLNVNKATQTLHNKPLNIGESLKILKEELNSE
ncbi:MAG TPA: dTDP-4-dehydrorhamnose reductase [Thermoprotei archaeon]|nr:dTDP-4-dehydrorhamnose reductase [Thermoprotei archaeon]